MNSGLRATNVEINRFKEMMMMMKKTSLIVLIISSLLLAACQRALPGQAEATPSPTPIMAASSPVVSATGKVVPADSVTLSMKTSGIVERILVDEDDTVTAGQKLIQLEGSEDLQAAVAAAQLEVVSAQQALDSLYENPDLALAHVGQEIVDVLNLIDDAERRLANYSRSAPQPDIDQAYANMILARDEYEDAQEDFEEYENKPEDNLKRARYLSKKAQAEEDYDAAVRHYNQLIAKSGDELDVAEAEADLALAKAQLKAAREDYVILEDGPDPDDVEIAQARLTNAEAQLEAAVSSLENLVLKAPFDGTISDLKIHTGEWVAMGRPVLQMADLSHLQVETTDLNEIDVARIRIGDTATVTYDALPDVEVTGLVTHIAPKDAGGSGVNYPIVLELEEMPAGLRWGMTAFVDIEVDE
jgi:HlyD family secretion protein